MKKLLVVLFLIVFVVGCGFFLRNKLQQDSFYKSFYEITSLIMTDWEKKVYKYLPNDEEKRKFIYEFWKRRDPTPETEENESRDVFYRRIAYANRWFSEGVPGRGWCSDRGRILIYLGYPDYRTHNNFRKNEDRSGRYSPVEVWHYERYRMILYFIDENDTGIYRQINHPVNLLSAIKQGILDLNPFGEKLKTDRQLTFKAKYKDNYIIIRIPVKTITFSSEAAKVKAQFKVTIFVYLNMKKLGYLKYIYTIKANEQKILDLKYCTFAIPYEMVKKGRYAFDIILHDLMNNTKYRMVITKKK